MRRAIALGAFVLVVLLAGCAGVAVDGVPEDDLDDLGDLDDSSEPVEVHGTLEIHHLDVGQADSTLILTPDGETILVDTGDWRQDGAEVLAYLQTLGIERIDHLVTTHGHADHIGGHAAVIEYYETEADGVGAVYDPGIATDTLTYGNYLDAVEKHDVRLFEVREGDKLPLADDQVTATILNPPDYPERGTDLHYNSVTLVVEFGEFRYLTTGDADEAAERRMVRTWGDVLSADVYQVGHHGSSTSSTPAFVHAVDPSVAVISSARESQYGHPHDEVLERFAEHNVDTYWTGVHGDVIVTTDGEYVSVEPSEPFSTDPGDLLEAKHRGEEQQDSRVRSVGSHGDDEAGTTPAIGSTTPRAIQVSAVHTGG